MDLNSPARQFCDAFFQAKTEQRLLFGVNEYSRELAEIIPCGAFIDDFYSESSVDGIPVISLADASKDAFVVSTLLGRPLTGKQLLDEQGLKNIDFFGFYDHCQVDLPEVRFWGGHRRDLEENAAHYEWVRKQLCEDESCQVWNKLLGLRKTGDLRHHEGFTDRQREQYFEPFLTYQPGEEVFVDVGCYDGATSLEFIRHCPGYKRIYAFEPESKNAKAVTQNLASHVNIEVINKALSSRPGFARISNDGSASKLNQDSGELIELARLDDCITEKVTFIKMDIEGAEPEALAGATNLILRDHPKMALAVYHQPSDLWSIPRQIFAIRNDYEIRLRHYTEGVVETVMYFIPRKGKKA